MTNTSVLALIESSLVKEPMLRWYISEFDDYKASPVAYTISALSSITHFRAYYNDLFLGGFDTLEEAKEACQTHYDHFSIRQPEPFLKPIEQCPNLVIREIEAERIRQIEVEGFNAEHDDKYKDSELSKSAMCFIGSSIAGVEASINVPEAWPWDIKWWKVKDKRRSLIVAAALIVAEVERLDRAEIPPCEVKP